MTARRLIKWGLVLIAALLMSLSARLWQVQYVIHNQALVITDLADSGYTPAGVTGHGNFVTNGADTGWYIYDVAVDDRVRKICVRNIQPQDHWDVDFIHFDGHWYKLRTGTATLEPGLLNIDPPSTKWRNLVTSPTAFDVVSPDPVYRLKILWNKLRYGSLSPREYVLRLKMSNPHCRTIPDP